MRTWNGCTSTVSKVITSSANRTWTRSVFRSVESGKFQSLAPEKLCALISSQTKTMVPDEDDGHRVGQQTGDQDPAERGGTRGEQRREPHQARPSGAKSYVLPFAFSVPVKRGAGWCVPWSHRLRIRLLATVA